MSKEELKLSIYDSYAAGEITEAERDDMIAVTEGLKDLVASFGTKKKAKEEAAAEKKLQKEREETKQKEEARQKKEEEEAKERQKAFLAKLNKAADKAAEDKKAENTMTTQKSNQNVILSYVKKCTEIQGKINDAEKTVEDLQKKIDNAGKDDNVKSLQGKKKYQEAQIKGFQKDIDVIKNTVKRDYGYTVKSDNGKYYAAECVDELKMEIFDTYAAGNITESERDVLLRVLNEQVDVISCDDEEFEEATRATEKLTEYKRELRSIDSKLEKLEKLYDSDRGTASERKVLEQKMEQLESRSSELHRLIAKLDSSSLRRDDWGDHYIDSDEVRKPSSQEIGKKINDDTKRTTAKQLIKQGKDTKNAVKKHLDMEPAKEKKDSIRDEILKILKEK